MNEFKTNNQELLSLIDEWEPKLLTLSEDIITIRQNSQNRTIKQIIGHMIDSASNNTHRIVHMQVFTVKKFSGEPTPSSEVEEIAWITSKNEQKLSLGSIFEHEVIPSLKAQNSID